MISDDLNPLLSRHNLNARFRSNPSKENVKPNVLNRVPGQKAVLPPKLRHEKKLIELTPEEEFKLLEEWEANYFIDFNSWMQIAKAKVSLSSQNDLLLDHK